MLTALTIHNVVLIERLKIDFQAGLCALTGETGAGKSILLDSLGLAIGARAESRLVRKGTDKAMVIAEFEPTLNFYKSKLAPMFEDAELDIETGESIILRRVVTADGRSKAFINDQSVSAGLLRRVGESLVEIHGQFDTRGLLDSSTHRGLLDSYAGIGDSTSNAWEVWKSAEQELAYLQQKALTAREDEAYLREAIEDLDGLSPQAGEEKILSGKKDQLRHREQVVAAINKSVRLLENENDPVGKASSVLERVIENAPEQISVAVDALDRALNEVEEARRILQSTYDNLMMDTTDIESVDDRLHALRAQARKHQCSVDDLAAKREDLASRLNMIEHGDALLAEKTKEVERARDAYIKGAKIVSETRKKFATKLDKAVMKELPPLKLERARFETLVEIQEESKWNASGMDSVYFQVATNPGSEAGALNKVASGGEMARFMLALKVVMAGTDSAETMLFDEVDAGVGGAVADAVGERLARLAHEGKQVMVVTHAPQVAARAGSHFIVRKDGANVVQTNVVRLKADEERREEIARMLSGATITSEARAAAETLLNTGRAA